VLPKRQPCVKKAQPQQGQSEVGHPSLSDTALASSCAVRGVFTAAKQQ
jgi:hypothetical protein